MTSTGLGETDTPVFLPENPMDRGALRAAVHGVESVGHDLATKLNRTELMTHITSITSLKTLSLQFSSVQSLSRV